MTCNLIDIRVGYLKLRAQPQQVWAPSKLGVSSPLGKPVQLSGSSFLVTMTNEMTLRNVSLHLCSFLLRIIGPLCLPLLSRTDRHRSTRRALSAGPFIDRTMIRPLILHTRCQAGHWAKAPLITMRRLMTGLPRMIMPVITRMNKADTTNNVDLPTTTTSSIFRGIMVMSTHYPTTMILRGHPITISPTLTNPN